MFIKVIACEIFFREFCHAAARSKNLIDLEFLTQGYHDIPKTGCAEIQRRIDATPKGKYDAIVLGYGLCSNIVLGLTTQHTPVVIPRAHDCITLFLGSRERYQTQFSERPGTFYYTSGWVECLRRRGLTDNLWGGMSLPAQAQTKVKETYAKWVEKYGEERANYLFEVMDQWTAGYTHGVWIDFDFVRHIGLDEEVKTTCANRGWQFEPIPGDMRLIECALEGDWKEKDFLILKPEQKVVAVYDGNVIAVE